MIQPQSLKPGDIGRLEGLGELSLEGGFKRQLRVVFQPSDGGLILEI